MSKEKPDLLEGLNDQQVDAVLAPDDKPVMVLAGPGAGKTMTVVRRIAYLLDNLGYDPERLLITTFSRRAAEELRTRVSSYVGSYKAHRIQMGTIHASCLNILRKEGFEQQVAESYQIKRFIQDAMKSSPHWTPTIKRETDMVGWKFPYSWIETAKLEMVPAQKGSAIWFWNKIIQTRMHTGKVGPDDELGMTPQIASALAPWFEDCYTGLTASMTEAGLMDFADMLAWTWRLLQDDRKATDWAGRYSYLITDESQDTSQIQFQILEKLAGEHFYAVGDVEQSIYTWRQANPNNMREFLDRHPNAIVLPLEVNYRSTRTIIEHSNHLSEAGRAEGAEIKKEEEEGKIKEEYKRHEKVQEEVYAPQKSLFSRTIRPAPQALDGPSIFMMVFPNDQEEAKWIGGEVNSLIRDHGFQPRDIFVLYRVNAQSRPVEEQLTELKVPHAVSSGHGFWTRASVQDLLAYLWMGWKPNDAAFMRLYNKASRYMETSTRYLGTRFIDDCKKHVYEKEGLWEGMQRMYRTGDHDPRYRRGIDDFMRVVSEVHTAMTLREKVEIASLHYSDWHHKEEGGSDADDPLNEVMHAVWSAASRHDSISDFLAWTVRISEAQKRINQGKSNNVYLSTVHAAKGLEARAVFAIGMSDSALPHWLSGGTPPVIETVNGPLELRGHPWLPSPCPTSIKDERYVAYVLVTRAKERLYLSWSKGQGRKTNLSPSRFITEMGLDPDQAIQMEPDE